MVAKFLKLFLDNVRIEHTAIIGAPKLINLFFRNNFFFYHDPQELLIINYYSL